MRLTASTGYGIELRIVGYEFPDCGDGGEWDSNWLVIEGKVVHPEGEWAFHEPCLTTWEVDGLACWLRSIARGEDAAPEFDPLEINLSFVLDRMSSPPVIRVATDFAGAPDSLSEARPVHLEFPVDPEQFLEAARSLHQQLLDYPERAAKAP
jgi:hypothetical protein